MLMLCLAVEPRLSDRPSTCDGLDEMSVRKNSPEDLQRGGCALIGSRKVLQIFWTVTFAFGARRSPSLELYRESKGRLDSALKGPGRPSKQHRHLGCGAGLPTFL